MAPLVGLGALLALAGCQSSGGTDMAAAPEPVRESELRAFCPQVQLRQGTAFYSSYQRGGQDDPQRLVHQASISNVTRACSYASDGSITMNVGVAGRVVPGPQGSAGQSTLPIRIAVVQGTTVLYSQLHQYPVNVQDTAGATQFVFNDPAVTIPRPEGTNIVVFAGFDEGPGR